MFARNSTGSSTTRVLAVLAAAGAAGAVLAGCTPHEQASDVPGTRPAVITGDQVPAGDQVNAGVARSGGHEEATVVLRDKEGTSVGFATFSEVEGNDAVTVDLRVSGLSAGVRGVHIHSVGKCEASNGFASAGDHLQVNGNTGKPESGDLASITVLKDGTGTVTSTTDAFTIDQIRGKALIVHDAGDTDGSKRAACGLVQAKS